MPSDYDATEFIDGDLQGQPSPHPSVATGNSRVARAPTREEVDSRVADAQQKLSELRRAQEELERERASLEETRRRQLELKTGRQELVQNLTRGVGLLEEAEFSARRDAEQMAKALVGFREALGKIQAIQEEGWTQDNFASELTKALTTLENARMEWNAARLKFEVLGATPTAVPSTGDTGKQSPVAALANCSMGELCRLGFALTWPIVVALLLGFGLLLALQWRH
jgi:chromosome segregation ATPase